MKMLLALPALLLVAGCSNKAVYDNLRHSQRIRCEQVPVADYERCMQNADKSYEEYERERQEYLEEREKITQDQS